jgi:hypothetical protein
MLSLLLVFEDRLTTGGLPIPYSQLISPEHREPVQTIPAFWCPLIQRRGKRALEGQLDPVPCTGNLLQVL